MTGSTAGERARPGTIASLRAALSSRRIAAVTLQSFSSGLPLGLIWIALPAWLAYRGVDIKTIGLFSLAQAPWTFKFLWAPLMDRYRLPVLGRKRSWMIVCQVFLFAGIALLATQAADPQVAMVAALAVFIAFWSASQDIAIDGYAVEVLERSEQGLAVGARVALYRAATLIAGAVAITVGERLGWNRVFWGLAFLFLPLMAIVVWSPEPAVVSPPPRTLREAVFDPLLDIFRRSRALQIIGFLLLYKFGENLATALTRPFLIQKCYSPEDVGLATATIGLVAIIIGTFFGGLMTERIGLGRALWLFGAIQAVGFLGYVAVDRLTPGAPRIEEVRQTLQKVFPDSLIADFRQTHPIITQGLNRATTFLSLVRLIALIVGALGVAGYAYYDTAQVAQTAIELFQQEIATAPEQEPREDV